MGKGGKLRRNHSGERLTRRGGARPFPDAATERHSASPAWVGPGGGRVGRLGYRPVRRIRTTAGLLAIVLFAAGCGDGTGVVELAWIIVDRDGEPIYPAGALTVGARGDSCGFAGRRGGAVTPVDLRLELQICDPACGTDAESCSDPACRVVDPLRFPCDTSRGSDPNVPADDQPYLFTFQAVLESPQGDLTCVDPEPTCVAVPGPRERTVKEGLVTDLQVVQIVMDVELGVDESLDLEACGCA